MSAGSLSHSNANIRFWNVIFASAALLAGMAFYILNFVDKMGVNEAGETVVRAEYAQRWEEELPAILGYQDELFAEMRPRIEATVNQQVDTAFEPVYGQIPAYADFHYSIRGQYTEISAVVIGKFVDTISTRLYDAHSPLLRYLATMDFPLPEPLRRLADFVLGTVLRRQLAADDLDPSRVQTLLAEAEGVDADLDRVGAAYTLQRSLEHAIRALAKQPEQLPRLRRLRRTAELAGTLPWDIELVRVQNELLSEHLPRFSEAADAGDPIAEQWRDDFVALGTALQIRTPDLTTMSTKAG